MTNEELSTSIKTKIDELNALFTTAKEQGLTVKVNASRENESTKTYFTEQFSLKITELTEVKSYLTTEKAGEKKNKS